MSTDQSGKDGIWQFKEMQPEEAHKGLLNDHFTFWLDGEHVTIRLNPMQPLSWKSGDDMYKLKCRWVEDHLEYLPPIGDTWVHLATFVNEAFVVYGDGQKKVFQKIEPGDVVEWNQDIVKPGRATFDYSLQHQKD